MKNDPSEPQQKKGSKRMILIIILSCVLTAALALFVVMFIQYKHESVYTASLMEGTTIVKGISIGGIDLAGMTKEEALAATTNIPADLLAKVDISLSVDGKTYKYTPSDLSISTDYNDIITQALAYAHTGTIEERKQAADEAKNKGVDFTVHVVADKAEIASGLQAMKAEVDKAPQDATVTFMPWGYTSDGKAYQPDVKAMVEAYARGKTYTRPDLVKIDSADTPNPLRYKYWKNDHYETNYTPADATISRFLYTKEAEGRSVDTDAVANQIVTEVQSGTYAAITVTYKVLEPTVKLADIKKNTQLIASWSSYFGASNHYGYDRNWNVSMMSSVLSGSVIQPGEEWSINDTAGPRNATTAKTVGWHEASGIENGGYTPQVGGGVCQLGSTTFNAAIRANLTVVKQWHHTIPSDYVPLGLDATLNTSPNKDLILKNDNTSPIYIVSYVNPTDRNVTVEIYGQLPVDSTYGSVIYDFTSDNKGTRFGTPVPKTIYCTTPTEAPDGTVIDAAHPTYTYAKSRQGTSIQTYKHIYSLEGKELCNPISYEQHDYPVQNGTTYIYGPDPATVTPTPTISTPPPVTPTPTPTPTP